MKRLLPLFILFSCAIHAQEIDHTLFRIHYASKSKKWEEVKNTSEDEKILDIGTKTSKFYSLWETKNEEIRDSVLERGGTLQDVQKALSRSPYPRSYQYYTVYKNYPQKGTLTFTDKVFKDYIYEESLETPQWEILTTETSAVAGYNCQKAQAKFRGRLWHVWFTADIPVNDGPWKLCGLPGLILKAEDSKKDFSFECIQIENKKKESIVIPKRNFLKCTRKKLEQIQILIGKDPDAYLRQLGYESQPGHDAKGKPLKYNKTAVLLEY